jgi:ADP-heptose:LPS heptosyltransferase
VPVRELLVVELLGGFGDLLLALPAVHALARAHPGAAVRVLTFAPGAALLAADPLVTSVIGTADHRDGAPRRAVAAQLDRCPPDLAVSTTCYDGIDRLLAARVPRAVTNLWRTPPADQPVTDRFLALLAADGLIPAGADPVPRVVLTAAERAAARPLLAGLDRPLLALPGAGMPVKRWPAGRWRELAAGWDGAVLTPAEGADLLPGARALPPLPLRGLAAVCAEVAARGGVAVGGDTGPVRLASAVGCPAVGLYGPTVAGRYGLAGPRTASLQGLPDCPVRVPASITEQECWWTARCPLSGDRPVCLTDLGAGQVLAAAQRVRGPA